MNISQFPPNTWIDCPSMCKFSRHTNKISILLGGIDNLLTGGAPAAGAPGAAAPSNNALLGDIFGLGNAASTTFYIPPKQEWLSAAKGKGLEIKGTFSRKNGGIFMDMTFANKAMQPISGNLCALFFEICSNHNSQGNL